MVETRLVPVVPQGLLDRLADGLEPGEVDHRRDRMGGEDLGQGVGIGQVDPVEGDVPAGELGHPLDGGRGRVRQVIGDDHPMALFAANCVLLPMLLLGQRPKRSCAPAMKSLRSSMPRRLPELTQ